MTMPNGAAHDLLARYREQLHDPDPDVRAVARIQLDALASRFPAPAGSSKAAPGRWGHTLVPLFEAAGNALHTRVGGLVDSGHEPLHGSRSGTCVAILPHEGRWYCRSCRRGGDAIAFVRELHGWSYTRARVYLRERFGTERTG